MMIIKLFIVVTFGISNVLLQDDLFPPPIEMAPPPPPMDSLPLDPVLPPEVDVLGTVVEVVNTTVVNETDSVADVSGLNVTQTITIPEIGDNNITSANEINQTLDLNIVIDAPPVNVTSTSDSAPVVTGNETIPTDLDLNITIPDTPKETITDVERGNASQPNVTDILPDLLPPLDQLPDSTGQGSENATIPDLPVDSFISDPLLSADPVDLPPPPFSLDFGLGEEIVGLDASANISGTESAPLNETVPVVSDTLLDGNATVVEPLDPTLFDGNATVVEPLDPTLFDSNATVVEPLDPTLFGGNATVIEPLDPTLFNGNATVVEALNATLFAGNATVVEPLDPTLFDSNATVIEPLDPFLMEMDNIAPSNASDVVETPVDIPALPPVDVPRFAINETVDSTTIEISDKMLGHLSEFGNVTPELSKVTQQTATVPMPVVTTPSSQETTLTTLETTTKGTPITKRRPFETQPMTSKETPDHPPPIFGGRSRPSIYTDQFGPHSGHFPDPSTTTTLRPMTKSPPPPPIAMQQEPDQRTSWISRQKKYLTPPPTNFIGDKQVNGLNPRYMNVAELADYALKHSTQKRPGFQVYFPTEPPPTTPAPTTTTIRPTIFGGYPKAHQASAFIDYLRKKYGVTTPRRQFITTTLKPVHNENKRRFFDTNYLLSQVVHYNQPQRTTTKKPIAQKQQSNDPNYFLSQTAQFTTSRPPTNAIRTATPKTRNARFFDASYLLSHLGDLTPKAGKILPGIGQQALPQRPLYQDVLPTSVRQIQPTKAPAVKPWGPNVNIKPVALNEIANEQLNGHNVLKDQREGQRDTRPINLDPPVSSQPFVDYNINPERNVRMFINLKPNIDQRQNSINNQQPKPNLNPNDAAIVPQRQDSTSNQQTKTHLHPNNVAIVPQTAEEFSRFKPVVYGNNQGQIQQRNQANNLKSRFNQKWYHPKESTGTSQPVRVAPVDLNIVRGDTVHSRPGPITDFESVFGRSFQQVNRQQQQNPSQQVSHQNLPRQHTFDQRIQSNHQQWQNQLRQQSIRPQQLTRKQQLPNQQQFFNQQHLSNRQRQQQTIRHQQQQQQQQQPNYPQPKHNQQFVRPQRQQDILREQQAEKARQQRIKEQAIVDRQQQQQLSNQQQALNKQQLPNRQQQQQNIPHQQQQQQQNYPQQMHNQQFIQSQKQQDLLREQQAEKARLQRIKEQAIVDRQQQHQETYFRIQQQKQEEALRLRQQDRTVIQPVSNQGQNINKVSVEQPTRRTEQNPLRPLHGQSEIRPNTITNRRPSTHVFQPRVPVSSVEIFHAPAFPNRRFSQHRQQVPQKDESHVHPETRWKAQVGLRHIHGHLPVQQTFRPTQAIKPTTPQVPSTGVTYMVTTPIPQTVVESIATLPPRPRPTTTTQKTPPPTADPNPPPIFDIKVKHTFMPMPAMDPTTKAPRTLPATNGAAGWSDSQNNGQVDERCIGCVFINERCLLPDPVHCSKFIECVRQGSMVRAFSRQCALSSFFDRRSFLCVDPKNADCPTDRCRIPGTKWYPIEGHCKHYWQCASREGGGTYPQSQCCPDMGGFVEGEGCIENPNCTASCESVIMQDAPTGCQLQKTASPTVYFDGNANIERPCAPGTVFNERACTCVQDVTLERKTPKPGAHSNCTCGNDTVCPCNNAMQSATFGASTCQPTMALTFDGGNIEDTSNTHQHIGNEGISVTLEGEAVSNGAGKLVLWRYANHMFPLVVAIRFRFLSTSPEPRMQTIFTNCDPKGGLEPSIEISLDTKYHEVLFKVNTLNGVGKRFSIIYPQNQWAQVDLIYDGERIVGSVDRRARNIFAGGGIETRPHPITVGSCRGKDGFRGLLDDVYVYEDCIPDDMYGIFMSVLE